MIFAARARTLFGAYIRCAEDAKRYAKRYATIVPEHFAPLPLDRFTHEAALADHPRLFEKLALRMLRGEHL